MKRLFIVPCLIQVIIASAYAETDIPLQTTLFTSQALAAASAMPSSEPLSQAVKVIYPNLRMLVLVHPHAHWTEKLDCGVETHQSSIPKDPDLLSKLGIKLPSNIFVVAGWLGDWANALAEKGARVTYSDLSSEIVSHVREKLSKSSKIAEYRVADALFEPTPDRYDWTFSYEPVPLRWSHYPWMLMRALANKGGGILVDYQATLSNSPDYIAQLEVLIRAYGLTGTTQLREPKTLISMQSKENINRGYIVVQTAKAIENKMEVLILKTDNRIRAMATLDIIVLAALQHFQGDSLIHLLNEVVANGIRCSVEDLKGSLARITLITDATFKNYRKELTLTQGA